MALLSGWLVNKLLSIPMKMNRAPRSLSENCDRSEDGAVRRTIRFVAATAGQSVLGKALRCLLVSVLLMLGACASSPVTAPGTADMEIVAKDSHFALVRLQDWTRILKMWREYFLGSQQEAWQLREVNADTSASPGQLVAVPLTPTNSSSVYRDGYRTLPILCYHQFTQNSTAAHRLELTAKGL